MKINRFDYHLGRNEIGIVPGPVERCDAGETVLPFYFHDPDGNLIDVSNYQGPVIS